MKYVSTRGSGPDLSFEDVLLAGLARDGGLYLPKLWPAFSPMDIRALAGLPYSEVVLRTLSPFVGDALSEADLRRLLVDAYAGFDHAAVVPLKQLDERLWLLELFHGPTLAFKDLALQVLGRLFDCVLERAARRITIVGATSGDTGSAAIDACRDRERIDIFMLHPKGRISEVQRRQMTTVASGNVFNIAVEGTFDDCQGLVKALFADAPFRDELALGAVNSINWARIAVQVAYYFAAAAALGSPERPVAFAVPTGNFGNVYAGYAAHRMGLPVAQLIVASNRNDILTRFIETGTLRVAAVRPTLSPSMDIQVSSNVERLLFDLYGGKGEAVTRAIAAFHTDGRLHVATPGWKKARQLFAGARADDKATLVEIGRIYEQTDELVDPHTAVGIAAARAQAGAAANARTPIIALATAHPAKFPDAVEQATGIRPPLPPRLADLFTRKERFSVLPNDVARLREFVRAHARRESGRAAGVA